jgi:hypothetical protein
MPPKPSLQVSLGTFLWMLAQIAVSLSHITASYRNWTRQPPEYSTPVTQASFTVGGSRDPYVLFRLRAAKRPTEPGPGAPTLG